MKIKVKFILHILILSIIFAIIVKSIYISYLIKENDKMIRKIARSGLKGRKRIAFY